MSNNLASLEGTESIFEKILKNMVTKEDMENLKKDMLSFKKEIKEEIQELKHEINKIKYKDSYIDASINPATFDDALSPAAIFGHSRATNSIYDD